MTRCVFHTLLCGVFLAINAFCAEPAKKPTFGGGMALQTGYVSLQNDYGTFDGIIFGLGGRLHFYINRFMRLGGGGAAVNLTYEDPGLEGSFVRINYGGFTAECVQRFGAWQFAAGLLAGGGTFTNLHIISESDRNNIIAQFEKNATFVLSPIITVERFLTEKLTLMCMLDYLWGPELGQKHHLGGLKAHIGILFNK